jgi:chromosome partitioning protein
MRVIALANHKGGVAKTTTAVNLSAGLARQGLRTLLLDADPQAHATYFFVPDITEVEADLQDLVMEEAPAEKVIVQTRLSKLDLVPATLNLAALDMQMVAMPRREDAVKRALKPLRDRYDIVIGDLPPNLAPTTVAVLAAADEIIVPVAPSRLAVLGLGAFIGWTEKYRAVDVINARLLGVLLAMYQKNTRISEETLAGLQRARESGQVPVFQTVIPRRVGVENDAADRLVVGDPQAHPDLNDAYQSLTTEVLDMLEVKR